MGERCPRMATEQQRPKQRRNPHFIHLTSIGLMATVCVSVCERKRESFAQDGAPPIHLIRGAPEAMVNQRSAITANPLPESCQPHRRGDYWTEQLAVMLLLETPLGYCLKSLYL